MNRAIVILVGLLIGGLVGVTLGVTADKPLPASHAGLLDDMAELKRRTDIDVTQAQQLHAENEEIEREIERLKSAVSGDAATSGTYWSDLQRYGESAATAEEILRELRSRFDNE